MTSYSGENPKEEAFSTSNLATLFEKEKCINTPLNPQDVSLAYKAPKQPKTILKGTNSIVFCAKTIKLAKSIRFFNEENRLGIALIGNENLHIYELILYKNKQNVLHKIKVNSAFIFNIDNNKSASFTDEMNDLLRVEFQSESDFKEFTQSIKQKGAQIVENQHTKSNLSTLITEETYIDNSALNVAEIIIPERKIALTKRLNNEPFNYLCAPNKTDHNLLPLAQHLPYHDINYATISHSNTFMADKLNTFMADNLNSFMAENRSQNCEMRMHMLQLSSKLDTILRDVKDITQNEHGDITTSLQQTINLLKREIDELRKQLDAKELNIEALEQLNCRLKCDLQQKCAEIDNLSEIKMKCQKNDITNNNSFIKSEIDDLSETVRMQQLKIDELQQYYIQSEIKNAARKQQSYGEFEIKESMNKLYQNILNDFDDTAKYDIRQIEESIAGNLRSASYELLQNIKNDIQLQREKL